MTGVYGWMWRECARRALVYAILAIIVVLAAAAVESWLYLGDAIIDLTWAFGAAAWALATAANSWRIVRAP